MTLPIILADVKARFNPGKIGGLSLWYAADKGFGALSDGDPIATWFDQSLNGDDLTQSTESKKPLYKTNILNGKPVVRFDGTDDFMIINAGLVQPEHVFCVFNLKQNSVNDNIFDGYGTGNLMRVYTSGAGPVQAMYAGASLGAITINTTSFYIASCCFNGASSEFRINGGNTASGDAGSTDGVGVTLAMWGNQSSNPTEVDFAEFIVYDSALSAGNRRRVEQYLASKYGLTLL